MNAVLFNASPVESTNLSQKAAAAASGLRASVVPHQPITNVELLGLGDLSGVARYFDTAELNIIANAGVFIIDRTAVEAIPYIRHQLTTDRSGVNTQEDSITTNVDSISYGLQARFAKYIGRYNISPEVIALIRAEIKAELDYRTSGTWTAQAGNQLNGYTILSIAKSAAFADRLEAKVRLDAPSPLNNLDIELIV